MSKDLLKIEWSNQPVLTTEGLAEKFGCSPKNLRDNFANNRDRFIEGKHYFKLEGELLRAFKRDNDEIGIAQNLNVLYLWTKRGVARHAKILSTDAAWEVYEVLEDTYFNGGRPQTRLEMYKEMVRLEEERLALESAYKSEKARADENQEAADFQKQATSKDIQYRIGTAAKCLSFEGLGQNKLFSFLREELGILFYNYDGMNEVKQEQIRLGRFHMKFNETYEYPVVYITVNGMRWLYNKLLEFDYKPLISLEEWERRCREIQEKEG